MALNKITNKEIEEKQVASLPDRMTGTAAENKAAFDALTKALIEKYNELIDTLLGQGGAAAIGSEPFAGVDDANTVRDQLMKLQANIADAVAGSIPDASITEAKLADNAVSAAKIADGAVTAAKIGDAEVTGAKLRALAVETAKLADGAVTAAKLADGAVTARTMTEDAIALAQAGLPRIQTGSYTGTGVSGSSNFNSLTFTFIPKIVFIIAVGTSSMSGSAPKSLAFAVESLTASYRQGGYIQLSETLTTSTNKLYAKMNGMTLAWYYDGSSDAEKQANGKANTGDLKYYWIAIG